MKHDQLARLCLVAATVLTGACSNSSHPNASMPPTPVPPTPVPQTLDTQQVLALAQKPSETAIPFVVNGGLLSFSDTSETSSPIAINGM